MADVALQKFRIAQPTPALGVGKTLKVADDLGECAPRHAFSSRRCPVSVLYRGGTRKEPSAFFGKRQAGSASDGFPETRRWRSQLVNRMRDKAAGVTAPFGSRPE